MYNKILTKKCHFSIDIKTKKRNSEINQTNKNSQILTFYLKQILINLTLYIYIYHHIVSKSFH